jgi:hypothetical protein
LINEAAKYDEMGVGSISNKDKADPMQLKWEIDRDDKIFGQKWKNKNSKTFKAKKSKKDFTKNKKKNFGKLKNKKLK